MAGWIARTLRLVRHRWAEGAALRALPSPALERITQRIAAAEQRHTGQIRVVVEGGLPWSYLWRDAPVRERALALFGKQRVWDTEHNNGVLIYLLVADHAIEIVADRGVARLVPDAQWHCTLVRMATAFQQQRIEEGLSQAIDEVSALLEQHFPTTAHAPRTNELPDAPLVQ